MNKNHIIIGEKQGGGALKLDVWTFILTRLLISANSGGGKSWLLRRLCEQLFSIMPVIIIDPEGEFATLREKFGFVLVGKGGETPADCRSAKLVMHKILELRASAVFDLYEMSVDERHRYVNLISRAAIDAPKNLWRPTTFVFDEVHEFCPESGKGESEARAAVLSFPTKGRKRRFGSIFATQRLAKLAKDARAEFQNRMMGQTFEPDDLKAAAGILGISGKDETADFFRSMRTMDSGNFFAFGRAICLEQTLVKVGSVETSHEVEDAKHGNEPPPPPEKVRELLPQLADLPKQAEEKAQTEAQLRSEVRRLTQELAKEAKTVRAPATVHPVKEVPVLTKDQEEIISSAIVLFETLNRDFEKRMEEVRDVYRELNGLRAEISSKLSAARNGRQMNSATSPRPSPPRMRAAERETTDRRPAAHSGNGNGHLPIGERKVLEACIQFPGGLRREQLTVLTGYKRSSRDAYVQRLREKDFLLVDGEMVCASVLGIDALPDAQPLPTGAALQAYWIDRLPIGEKALLQVVLDAYPAAVTRDALTEATNYLRSSRDAYLQRMRAKQIITEPSRGEVRAADTLFQ